MNRSHAAVRTFTLVAALCVAAPCFTIAALALTSESEVDQIGLRFTRQLVELKTGAVMKFHNSDDVIHNIMTIDKDDLTEDFGLQKPGEDIHATFSTPGSYQVRCSIHPKMKMTVNVSN